MHNHDPLADVLAAGRRLVSLDAFRGFTIIGMVIVNDPANWAHVYAPLRHAEWHGVTPTDLVFPFFLFIVGVSIALAFTRRLRQGMRPQQFTGKIIRRTLILFALGVFLWLWPEFDFSRIRWTGVLQRIAVVYGVCAFLFLYTSWRTQAWLGAGILVAYWLAMCFLPTPGYDAPMLEPGKNLAAWVDHLLLPGVMWQKTWDPEGILSTFPAIATGISGMLAGRLLLAKADTWRRITWLMLAGYFSYVIGSAWDWFFPINKNLWTSSYVMYTSGLAAMTFGATIWLVDVKGIKTWTWPGVVFGANAITAYVLHSMLNYPFRHPFFETADGPASIVSLFFDALTAQGLEPRFVSLLWALLYTAIVFLPVYWLYRKRIFIRI